MNNKSEWAFYLAGALLTLAWKWYRWVRTGRTLGKSIRRSTAEWFSLALLEEKASWLTTIAAVWAFGALYIGGFLGALGFMNLPVLNSLAFLLGCVAEIAAPNLVKWTLSKLPAGQ